MFDFSKILNFIIFTALIFIIGLIAYYRAEINHLKIEFDNEKIKNYVITQQNQIQKNFNQNFKLQKEQLKEKIQKIDNDKSLTVQKMENNKTIIYDNNLNKLPDGDYTIEIK